MKSLIIKLKKITMQPIGFASMLFFLLLSISLDAVAVQPGISFQTGLTLLVGCAICFVIFIVQMLVYYTQPDKY